MIIKYLPPDWKVFKEDVPECSLVSVQQDRETISMEFLGLARP